MVGGVGCCGTPDVLATSAAKSDSSFAFTKKLTFEPHAINTADIDALRKHYDDARITEIILAVAGFNSMNRWTGPLRIPQEERSLLVVRVLLGRSHRRPSALARPWV